VRFNSIGKDLQPTVPPDPAFLVGDPKLERGT
jgi:hypothetical protein